MKKEIAIIDEVSPLAERVANLTITNPAEAEAANELLSQANKVLDRIEAEEQKVLRPLLDATAAERARWKPSKDKLKPAIEAIRKLLGAYQSAELARVAEQEAKIAERAAKGQLRPETAVAKMDALEKPSATVATSSGSTKFRPNPNFEVVDLSLVPIAYHLADEVAIRKAMKEGTELPGVRYFVEQIPVNSR